MNNDENESKKALLEAIKYLQSITSTPTDEVVIFGFEPANHLAVRIDKLRLEMRRNFDELQALVKLVAELQDPK